MNMRRPEITVVILCCRVYLQTSSISTLCTYIYGHPVDWGMVYKLSARHKVRPLVYFVLSKLRNIVPPEGLQLFRNYCREFSVFAFDRKIVTDEVLSCLNRHGVTARFYKGMDLALLLYGDISMREFTDMDIMIPEEQIATVVSVMRREGYEMHLEEYYSSYPAHFQDNVKEVVFGKPCSRGKWLSFEFHYRPPQTLMTVQYRFDQLLGCNYLSGKDLTAGEYYRMMLVNNGACDFYPHLRSIVDMVLLYRQGAYEIPDELRPFEALWMQLASTLLGHPERVTSHVPIKTKELLIKRLLDEPSPKENKFLQLAFIRLSFMPDLKAKFAVVMKYLTFLLKPNGEDVVMLKLPYFFLYYFTKPFRLTTGLIRRLR